jgi:hypothetical protein
MDFQGLQALAIVRECFVRLEIEHCSPIRSPPAMAMHEYGGGAAKIAHGLDIFHITSMDCLELDRHAAQRIRFPVGAVRGEP